MAALVAALVAVAVAPTRAMAGATGIADPSAWTVYHGDVAGHGVSSAVASVDTARPAWRSPPLDGALYGEPLVAGGLVYVATEDDRVYALAAGTGRWCGRRGWAPPFRRRRSPAGTSSRRWGSPARLSSTKAGARSSWWPTSWCGAKPAHMLVGLSTATGQVEMTVDVDPPGSVPSALLQRTGLTLDAGQVVFGFGGNYGDCSTYRGRVVAAGESGGTVHRFAVDAGAGEDQGAIWMGGGAPAVDDQGNIWVSAGNGSVTSSQHAYDNSDSVLQLSPDLRLLQVFAPSGWAADNAADRDLSMEPALLGDGQVVVAGKSRIAFLLDGAHLGGIGGQLAALGSVCTDDVDGGAAVEGMVVYLPCTTGVVAVRTSPTPPAIRLLWSSGAGGGPPIVAGGLVWTIAANGSLLGLDATTGAVRQQAAIGAPANHFPTPAVGDSLLLAPSADRVVAFTATAAGSATTVPPASTSTPARTPRAAPPDAAGLPAGAIAGIAVGAVAVVGVAAWLLGRRRVRARRRRVGG